MSAMAYRLPEKSHGIIRKSIFKHSCALSTTGLTNQKSTHRRYGNAAGRLQDKVAIVTGASSGLGRAISFAYAKEGAHVVCADLLPLGHDSGKPTHELINQETDRRSTFVRVDVGNSHSVQDLVTETVKTFGRVDMCASVLVCQTFAN
jgi:hypothetical protein